jgi:cell shape-determining protein MreD
MLKITFIFIILFLSIYLEVLCGSFGIIIPFTAFSIFYLSITYSLKSGILIGFIAGTILDTLYGRTFLISPFLMAGITLLADYWLYQGEPESPIIHFLPGLAVTFLYVFPLILFNIVFQNIAFSNSLNAFFSLPAGAFILPFYLTILDYIAYLTDLPQYKFAKKRALEEL